MATETQLPGLEDQNLSPRPTSPAPIGEGEISILDLLITLAECKWLIAKVTAAFAIASVLVSLLLPQRYTAAVLLLPPQQNSSLGAQLASQFSALGGVSALATGAGFLRDPNAMYVSMLKSRTVEDAMVNHFGLMQEYHKKYLSDARKTFERRANVDGSGKDNLIRISVEDRDPKRAAELANGYVDQFRQLSEHLAIGEAGQRRLFFEQQMNQAKNNLANAEVSLAQTEQKTGVIQLDSQARALIESAATLRAQINAKEIQIQSMETYATGENAQLVQAREELDGLNAQLARLGSNAVIPGSGLLPAKGQMTEAGVEYVRRLREVRYSETIFEILARQFELAKLEEAKEGALIQVVDAATVPDKRSFPKRGQLVILATLVGIFIGVCWALMVGWLTHENTSSGEFKVKLSRLRRTLQWKRTSRPGLL